jgi:hypothetical protein
LATLPRDRYVARVAAEEKGTMVTPAIELTGGVARMTVNACVNDKGELRIRALDENGSPLAGFDFADCIAIRGDNVAHAVRWTGGDAERLSGRPVRFESSLRNAAIYGFDLSE